MRSYLRYWHETFALPVLPREHLATLVRFAEPEAFDAAIARGQGTLVVLSHSANWDTAGAWLAMTQRPFTTVAERVRPASLYERFVEHRRSFGIEVLAADGGHQVLAVLAQRLRDGRTVCLLADRVIGNASGVPVRFFDEPAHMPGGPASLALRTGCSLVAIHLHYDGDSIVARAEAIDSVSNLPEDREGRIHAVTQRMADSFERAIAEHPTDWHMLQPLWDADRTSVGPA
jgi:KDO2-lipid IV(A) lauroyltransferase